MEKLYAEIHYKKDTQNDHTLTNPPRQFRIKNQNLNPGRNCSCMLKSVKISMLTLQFNLNRYQLCAIFSKFLTKYSTLQLDTINYSNRFYLNKN